MKKMTLLFLSLVMLISASRGQDGTDVSKIMNDLKKQLPEDPVYTSLLHDSWAFQDKIAKGLRKGIQIETKDPANPGLLQELNAVNPADINRIKSVLSSAFENAEELMDIVTRNQEKQKEFKNKFPFLFSLKPEETAAVLATAAETYYSIEENSNGLLAPGGVGTGPDAGPCETGRENDRSRCHRNARLESAVCGVMTSTILGSLICGAYVLLHERNCMDQAQIDYLICLARR